MLRVLLFLILIAVGATGAVWLADNPGDVVVTWQSYRIETSIVIALMAVIALTGVLGLVWTIIRAIFRLPGLLALASRNRRRSKGFTSVTRGMIAVGAGDSNAARRHAAEAEKMLGGAPLVLLLKAQTAQMAGDRSGAETAFKRMIEDSETRVLGLRGLHVEAQRRGDDVAALSYAREASRLAPGAAWASEAVLIDQCTHADWAGARTTLDRRVALRMIDKPQAKSSRAALLTAEAQLYVDTDPSRALALAKEALALKPGLTPAAALAGRQLARQGDLRKATRLLEAAWKIAPHPDVAAAYLDIRQGDSTRDRLQRARTLHKLAQTSDEARLTLMQTAIAASDYPLARQMLSDLLANTPTARVYLAAADLATAEHGDGGEVREMLSRAARADRDPAWCADGVVSEHWLPVSPVTGHIDAFTWTKPAAPLSEVRRQRPSLELETSKADQASVANLEPLPSAAMIDITPAQSHPASKAPSADNSRMTKDDVAAMRPVAADGSPISDIATAQQTAMITFRPRADAKDILNTKKTTDRISSPAVHAVPPPPDDPGPFSEQDDEVKQGFQFRR
jgi:HemY protein